MAIDQSVVLFMIDGMRPDALQRAEAPEMKRLQGQGASTMRGRTVMPSITLPCHTSLFRGVEPQRHGITSNQWHPLARPMPSLLDVVHAAGGKTLAYYNWEELRDLGSPGSLDESHLIHYKALPGDESDQALFDAAARRLAGGDFSFAFLYYGAVDLAGHEHGWMSKGYIDQIAHADRAVGKVLRVLPENCLVVLLADHGGHDKTHGTDVDVDMQIPIMLRGTGIAAGTALEEPVNITDVGPTIAKWLKLDVPEQWKGRSLIG